MASMSQGEGEQDERAQTIYPCEKERDRKALVQRNDR